MKNHWRFQLSKRILSQGVRWLGLISLDGWHHSAICTLCSMFYSTLYKLGFVRDATFMQVQELRPVCYSTQLNSWPGWERAGWVQSINMDTLESTPWIIADLPRTFHVLFRNKYHTPPSIFVSGFLQGHCTMAQALKKFGIKDFLPLLSFSWIWIVSDRKYLRTTFLDALASLEMIFRWVSQSVRFFSWYIWISN